LILAYFLKRIRCIGRSWRDRYSAALLLILIILIFAEEKQWFEPRTLNFNLICGAYGVFTKHSSCCLNVCNFDLGRYREFGDMFHPFLQATKALRESSDIALLYF
jgi:hypothetical protein